MSLMKVLADAGYNTIRQRYWVSPKQTSSEPMCDTNYGINMAKEIKAAGTPILEPEFLLCSKKEFIFKYIEDIELVSQKLVLKPRLKYIRPT